MQAGLAKPNDKVLSQWPAENFLWSLPSDAVEAIYGAGHVVLRGFESREACSAPWYDPAAVFVSAPHSAAAALEAIDAERRRRRWHLLAPAVVLAVLCFCAGAAYSLLAQDKTLAQAQPLIWEIVSMDAASVLLATDQGRVRVPLGGRLPSGEVVLQVDAAHGEVKLRGSTIRLRPLGERGAGS